MRFSVHCIFVLACLFSIGQAFSQDTIHWRSNYELSWDDYRAVPEDSIDHDAVSAINISYQLKFNKKEYQYDVFCVFDKKDSWVKQRDSVLLSHEQVHFNIHELFARKIRREFKNYRFNYSTIKTDFQRIFENLVSQSEAMNKRYDVETNFSKNRKAQDFWNENIARSLTDLEQFKSQ